MPRPFLNIRGPRGLIRLIGLRESSPGVGNSQGREAPAGLMREVGTAFVEMKKTEGFAFVSPDFRDTEPDVNPKGVR